MFEVGITFIQYNIHCVFMVLGPSCFLTKGPQEVPESTGTCGNKLRFGDTRKNFQNYFPVPELKKHLVTVELAWEIRGEMHPYPALFSWKHE